MKRKSLLFLLLMALFAPWAAQAQETLTVYGDGTNTNSYVPVYGGWADACTKSEFVMPAEDQTNSLSAMTDGTITKIKFYVSSVGSYGSGWYGNTFQIFMKEINTTTISAYQGTDNATIVYEGALETPAVGEYEIELTTPYVYGGGNLLVGIYNLTNSGGGYRDVTFTGKTVSNASGYGYSSSSLGAVGFTSQNFIPKTTFTYEPASCPKPTLEVSNVTAHGATLTWESETAEYFNLEWKKISAENWSSLCLMPTTHSHNIGGLDPDTKYQARVMAVCDSQTDPENPVESDWREITFTTDVACPAPANFVANNITARSAVLSWTGSSNSYTLQTGTIGEVSTVTVLSEGFEGGAVPTGWTSEGDGAWSVKTGDYSSSTGAHSGSYNASYVHTSSGNSCYFVTPAMDLSTAVSATINLWYINRSWSGDTDEFGVFYRVNGGEWHELFNTAEAHSSWTEIHELSLPNLAANYQIGFKTVDHYGYYASFDDVEIVAQCASITWTDLDNNATSPYTFDNLDPETTYRLRLIGDCGNDGTSDPSDVLTFTTTVSCPAPTNLDVTTDGVTATATWEGAASTYNININGTVYNNVTSPYEFPVELSTTYAVMMQANCTGETSGWTDAYSFTTPACIGGHTIEYVLNDSYGDGWTGSTISAILVKDACSTIETLTIPSDYSANGTLTLCGDYYEFVWQAGQYPSECSFTLIDNGVAIYSNQSGSGLTNGQVLHAIGTNPNMLPKPTGLAAGDSEARQVELSWTENGEATAWQICVNDDEENLIAADSNPFTLASLTPDTEYTVKVRATNGINVSCWSDEVNFTTPEACPKPTNVTASNITFNSADIAWTGNDDATSYNLRYRSIEGFEGGMGDWTAIDADQDGYDWVLSSQAEVYIYSGNVSGQGHNSSNDLIVSGSYVNTSDSGGQVLYPDNYLVSPMINLGGSISFYAHGSNMSYVAEHFGVFVSTNSNDNPDDFVMVNEWTASTTEFIQYSADLSTYSGQGYVAIRHFNCSDQFLLSVDDIAITEPDAVQTWTLIEDVTSPYSLTELTDNTTYEIQVKSLCGGEEESNWVGTIFTTPYPTFTMDIVGYGEEEGHWYLIASPLAGETNPTDVENMIDAEGNYDLYYFDQAGDAEGKEWINYKDATFNLVNGKGYLYASKEDTQLTFTGTPFDGDGMIIALDYTDGAELAGWNLVGNPFTVAAYLDKDFYVLNDDRNEVVPAPTDQYTIAPMEGAFVCAGGEGEFVTISLTAPDSKSGSLAINLTQGRGVVDRAVVRFGHGSLPKFQLNPNHTKVYIPMEGKDYAVVSAEAMGELPVNFKAEKNGTYSLSFTAEEVNFSYLHLIDNMTGTDVDLLQTPSYSFEAKTTDYESRFRLVFATGSSSDNNFAFYSNGSFVINNEGEATLQVIDVNGRILKSESINGCASLNFNAAPGVYMIRLIQGNDVKVQKVVVK